MKILHSRLFWLLLVLTLMHVSCRQEDPAPDLSLEDPATDLSPAIPAEPARFPTQVANYSLGETTILQEHFPEDSPFRHMPVRLNGVIGVPQSEQQHPVVLIMHGKHVECPVEFEWPCSAEEEQKNYEGFTYLVEALAEAGYVALSIDVNAEHTLGFGEAPPTVRTKQLVDRHLQELAAANAGQSNAFGVDLTGRVDLTQMAWLGHSRGGDYANWIVRDNNLDQSASEIGYGPVQGIIHLASPAAFIDALPAVDLPTAIILPACDWDVPTLGGQQFYESARFNPARENLVTSVYLEHANHNNFNTILPPDPVLDDRPDCAEEILLSPEAQQDFLTQYTLDFMRLLYAESAPARTSEEQLGILPSEPASNEIFGAAARVNLLAPSADNLPLILPDSEKELSQNLQGGDIQSTGITTAFCPDGYFGPNEEFGSGSCKRFFLNQPGYPQQLLLTWDQKGAEWRMLIPETAADLSEYTAIQLRTAIDPLSNLNSDGRSQTFTLELVDTTDQAAQIALPSVAYPEGVRIPNDQFEGDTFTGHVYMETLRVPLEAIQGIDLSAIAEIALIFDKSQSGALFFADLDFVKGD